jgi:ribulose-5-phosphate 4-epimerase/fuculose-1-phosphate aldolase|tara:strand:+ start:1460 stop:2248 length:789 start_codon:yes stop_codon:yes gene_type:complete
VKIAFKNSYPKCPKGMSVNEWKARVDLAAIYRLTDYYGWTSVVYNHITLRIPDTDTFLINPFGLRYDEINASNLIKIDLDGNKLDPNDWPINQAGYNIHSAIHKARNKDLHCVMHTHEPMSQTIAALKEKVIPMFQEACQLYERVGYHDFEGIVLDASEKKRLIKSLGKSNHTLVLRNHGLITAGPSAIWAFIRHQVFIRNAEIQLRAMSSGGKIIKIPKKIMVHTRKQFEGGAAQGGAEVRHPEWPAYWRLLDKLDPSWKK